MSAGVFVGPSSTASALFAATPRNFIGQSAIGFNPEVPAIALKSQLGQLGLQQLLILSPIFSGENAELKANTTPPFETESLPLELASFLQSEIRELLFQSISLGTVAKMEANFKRKHIQREVEAFPSNNSTRSIKFLGVKPTKTCTPKRPRNPKVVLNDSKNIDKESFDLKQRGSTFLETRSESPQKDCEWQIQTAPALGQTIPRCSSTMPGWSCSIRFEILLRKVWVG
ncbi:MAG: hypothetical protein IPP17_25070 [Bacteroidetes bacterium]|nr:hypothetical protein [Bacteroidota bacterium]